MAFLWIASFALPAQCLVGPARMGACQANGPVADAAARQPRLPAKKASAFGVAAAPIPAVAASVPTQSPQPQAESKPAAQGLIAATFEQLQMPPAAAGAGDNRKPAEPVVKASETVARPGTRPSGPTARLVETTVIRADVAADSSADTPATDSSPVAEAVSAPVPAVRMALVAAPDPAPIAKSAAPV
jgi:hypothetical protein